MVAVPPTDERLAAIKQIGVDHLVYYDMCNTSEKFAALEEAIVQARRFGLSIPVVESGPPIDRIVLGLEGWREQTQEWIHSLERLGRFGVDADVDPNTVSGLENPISLEQTLENLRRFLLAVIPAAEAAGVNLAMHPDDPPVTPICGYERVMSSVESFDWLLEAHASPMNGVTLCAGCFGELGLDVSALVERFRDRIHYVHLRNIHGRLDDFIETFPDDGDLDLADLIRTLHASGFDGYIRADHAPLLATETTEVQGYGFQGHLFTTGYLRGLLDAVGSDRLLHPGRSK